MTRFKIIGIFTNFICTSTEFNGDGYFEGWGNEVCKEFKMGTAYTDIVKMVNESFGYNEQLTFDDVEESELDFYTLKDEHKYYEVWFSDYLYIKNFSKEDITIRDENGTNIIIHPNGWVTLNFGELYEYHGGKDYFALPNENVEIGLPERLDLYVDDLKEQNIDVLYVSDSEVMIQLFAYLQDKYQKVCKTFEWHLEGKYFVRVTNIEWVYGDDLKLDKREEKELTDEERILKNKMVNAFNNMLDLKVSAEGAVPAIEYLFDMNFTAQEIYALGFDLIDIEQVEEERGN